MSGGRCRQGAGRENVRSEITDFRKSSEFERCGISRGFDLEYAIDLGLFLSAGNPAL